MKRLSGLFAPLLEKRCAACSAPIAWEDAATEHTALCASCSGKLQRRHGGYCPVCGNMTALDTACPSVCGTCISRRDTGKAQPWNALFFFAAYEGYLRDLILRCKAGQELPLARLLGSLLAGHPGISPSISPGTANGYDAVIPIPLHVAKLRKRGFNQALEMARPVSKRLGVPLLHNTLVRTAETHSQSGLTIEDRKRNVHNAFETKTNLKGLKVLLVDDIATTCATLEEAALTLKKSGVEYIDAAVLARTPEHFPG